MRYITIKDSMNYNRMDDIKDNRMDDNASFFKSLDLKFTPQNSNLLNLIFKCKISNLEI